MPKSQIQSIRIEPYTLKFKEPAGTSRGIYRTRKVWYLLGIDSAGNEVIGEVAPLPDLSREYKANFETELSRICHELTHDSNHLLERYHHFPSILMGIEMLLSTFMKRHSSYASSFTKGESSIPINGLIWMGSYDEMLKRIEKKKKDGFRCLKLKVGAIDIHSELELLKIIRSTYPKEQLEIRLDANGAFSADNVMKHLDQFASYDIHSIEQPIQQGQWGAMRKLTKSSPIPIALDEELIGVNKTEAKVQMLDIIRPQYIILKPSLHGAFSGCDEWIRLAQTYDVSWWATSALESNIGLNAIAQWVATYEPSCPQGLGTGMLYENNIPSPIYLKGTDLYFDPQAKQILRHNELLSYLRRNAF